MRVDNCPFCGAVSKLTPTFVYCSKCGLEGPRTNGGDYESADHIDLQNAVKNWNRLSDLISKGRRYERCGGISNRFVSDDDLEDQED